MSSEASLDTREWLEADGLGGFASGTASGLRTRRYHSLLCRALKPPIERRVLISGLEVWWVPADSSEGGVGLSVQRYQPDVLHPRGDTHIENFRVDPWPTWSYRFGNGVAVRHELFVVHGTGAVVLKWSQTDGPRGRLRIRPLVAGRDYHHLHRENDNFRFDAHVVEHRVTWQSYPHVPPVRIDHNGDYHHEPLWFRNFLYSEERDRGLDFIEDLASPGEFSFSLESDALLVMQAEELAPAASDIAEIDDWAAAQADAERQRRARLGDSLNVAAEAYLVRRATGRSIIAGYPWFSDWGRDTFIAIRGLCLASGRLIEAREILLAWAGSVSEGMVPNRFTDDGPPEFNAVDASLWFVIAAAEFISHCNAIDRRLLARADREELEIAIEQILDAYAAGTRFGIHLEIDGLIAAGEPGVQLTWMDAKVGEYVVTPRIGKPVEVQALWLNALKCSSHFARKWETIYRRGLVAFCQRFWNESEQCLYDVVDANHESGTVDAAVRINQILAVGGLPEMIVPPEMARQIVDRVETDLWTPAGLRSLSPHDPNYRGNYGGDPLTRDEAYHQGTIWPWLAGPFIEAWVRVHGGDAEAKQTARERFLEPLLQHFNANTAEPAHLPELAQAQPPHAACGCPFQAWSVAEALRLTLEVLK